MASVNLHDAKGKKSGTVDLDAGFFGIQPNVPVMHQVVTAQLAGRRAGTQSTKTRAEVRGGGAKPYRQKGTGNARQGSIRAPHYAGGGVALGPKPRKYTQRTPKKMIRLALRSALSDRAADGKVVVVDEWGLDAPSTKGGRALLDALGVAGRTLVVVHRDDVNVILSLRNIPEVQLLETTELNAYDVLCHDWIVFSKSTLPAAPADHLAEAEVEEEPKPKPKAKAKKTDDDTGSNDEVKQEPKPKAKAKKPPETAETTGGEIAEAAPEAEATGAEGSASDEAQSSETKAKRTSSETDEATSSETNEGPSE